MWGGHRLQNHPQNPSQNSSKRVNHPVRIGRKTGWSPRVGNATSHITHHNWAWVSSPGLPPTSISNAYNTDASEIPTYIRIHAAQVYQWRQMVNTEDILKHLLLSSLDEKYFNGKQQAYQKYANLTLAGLIQHLYDDHGTISSMDLEESEQKMKQEWSLLDPMVDLFEKLKKEWSSQNPLTTQPEEGKGSHCLPADTQNRRDGKSPWIVVRHAGWTENLAGFQTPFHTSLQELRDPQESNSSSPWVWGVIKSYTGDRDPSQNCRWAASTRMFINGIQGGNGKPHQH